MSCPATRTLLGAESNRPPTCPQDALQVFLGELQRTSERAHERSTRRRGAEDAAGRFGAGAERFGWVGGWVGREGSGRGPCEGSAAEEQVEWCRRRPVWRLPEFRLTTLGTAGFDAEGAVVESTVSDRRCVCSRPRVALLLPRGASRCG